MPGTPFPGVTRKSCLRHHQCPLLPGANQYSRQTETHIFFHNSHLMPGGSDSKESACNAGGLGSIPGSGRSPGNGNGNPLQYSHLENPMAEDPGGL